MADGIMAPAFPVGFAQATQQFSLGSHATNVTAACILFSDRVTLLLTGNGKLGQVLTINTSQASLPQNEIQTDSDMSMLPDISLTPDWVLGASETVRSEMASLISVQITSALMNQGLGPNQRLLYGLNFPGGEEIWRDNESDGENHQRRQEVFIGLVALAVKAYVLAKA